jgi:hypothetical protein
LRRLYQARIVGESEIVVGAKIEHAVVVVHPYFRRLWAVDDALGLVKTGRADLVDYLSDMGEIGVAHDCT